MEKGFCEAVKSRRTFYAIKNSSPINDAQIEDLVKDSVKHVPSPFNSQSARVLLLFGKHHQKFWEIAKEELKKVVPEKDFLATEEKINKSFASGYATILYFEDMAVVKKLQEQFDLYKDHFPVWSNQSNGMLQHTIWTALEMYGFGASLQHYNPLIDERVKEEWSVPSEWKLLAEMPFGVPIEQPGEKEFSSLDARVKVFK